ncbi:MAG: hypothetical protein PVI86_02665 [Phycisphaerae bacterium]|jgi:hypothetical protein
MNSYVLMTGLIMTGALGADPADDAIILTPPSQVAEVAVADEATIESIDLGFDDASFAFESPIAEDNPPNPESAPICCNIDSVCIVYSGKTCPFDSKQRKCPCWEVE